MRDKIPETVCEALKELSGIHRPPINVCRDADRLYLRSTLAIELTWYEKDLNPVREGYQRTFYYTHKEEFPHSPVFTYLDTKNDDTDSKG